MPFVFPNTKVSGWSFWALPFFDKNHPFPINFRHWAKSFWTFYKNHFDRVVKTAFYVSGRTFWKTSEKKLCVQNFRKLFGLWTKKVSANSTWFWNYQNKIFNSFLWSQFLLLYFYLNFFEIFWTLPTICFSFCVPNKFSIGAMSFSEVEREGTLTDKSSFSK